MKTKLACFAVLAFVLAPTSLAGAQAVQDTYRGQSKSLGVIGEIEQVNPPEDATGTAPQAPNQPAAQPTAAPEQASALPFTGSEVLIVALGGLALVGLGFGLRRMSTTRPTA
jgi:hypothetical protein